MSALSRSRPTRSRPTRPCPNTAKPHLVCLVFEKIPDRLLYLLPNLPQRLIRSVPREPRPKISQSTIFHLLHERVILRNVLHARVYAAVRTLHLAHVHGHAARDFVPLCVGPTDLHLSDERASLPEAVLLRRHAIAPVEIVVQRTRATASCLNNLLRSNVSALAHEGSHSLVIL